MFVKSFILFVVFLSKKVYKMFFFDKKIIDLQTF